jgi:LPXTG-motif cell wall-anchored protein
MRTNLGSTQRAALALGGAATLTLLGLAAPAQAAASNAAAPAHASSQQGGKAAKGEGEDRRATSLKDRRGHNDDWQAQSDPDGQENGGVDQPGGAGGVNTDDQDGNNGTGNDSDCEDDNRGKGVPGHCKDKDNGQSKTPDQGGDDGTDGTPGQPEQAPAPSRDEDEDEAAPVPTPGPGTTVTIPGTTAGTTTGTTTVAAPREPQVLGVEQLAAGRAPAAVTVEQAPTVERAATVERTAAAVLPNTGTDAALLALLAGGLGTVATGTVLVRRRATA